MKPERHPKWNPKWHPKEARNETGTLKEHLKKHLKKQRNGEEHPKKLVPHPWEDPKNTLNIHERNTTQIFNKQKRKSKESLNRFQGFPKATRRSTPTEPKGLGVKETWWPCRCAVSQVLSTWKFDVGTGGMIVPSIIILTSLVSHAMQKLKLQPPS